jgi:hypothetical protein
MFSETFVSFHPFNNNKMKNKFSLTLFLLLGVLVSCKKELDVVNPNQPTPESAATENGILALGQGGVYISGFRGLDGKFNDGVPGYFWSGAMGMHALMGDEIGEEAANWFMNQLGCPDEVVLDNGTVVTNPQNPHKQYDLLREVNQNANQGQNPTFHEWANMYNLNNACNNILSVVENVRYVQGGDVKKATIQAWAYWWKGFAYSRIGSIYYAGVINNDPNKASAQYVTKEAIIAEANANFDKAASLLGTLSAGGFYDDVMAKLIPDFCQLGKGGVPAPDAWLRNIKTMKARNILVNTPVANMTATQWGDVLALTSNGIKADDNVFTGRSNESGDVWSPLTGTVAAKATGSAGVNTYKISERLMQDFKAGDKRKDNNFTQAVAAWIGNADRGITFNTRWGMTDGGNGLPGVIVYSDRTAGGTELYLAGSYEENALMNAEARIYTGDVEGGLALIDAIRSYQGAGLDAVAGNNLTAAQAKEELRHERRSALAFRNVSFYDARRWGIIENGRTGCTLIDANATLNNNATIRYNFLDYWDVPDNELAYNPAGDGSAPTKNPK